MEICGGCDSLKFASRGRPLPPPSLLPPRPNAPAYTRAKSLLVTPAQTSDWCGDPSTSGQAGSRSLLVEWRSLREMREVLRVQRGLQQELEVRWSDIVQRDAETLGLDAVTWEESVLAKAWLPGDTNEKAFEPQGQNGIFEKEAVQPPNEAPPAVPAPLEIHAAIEQPLPFTNVDSGVSFQVPQSMQIPVETAEYFNNESPMSHGTLTKSRSKVAEVAAELELAEAAQEQSPEARWIKLVKSDKFDLLMGAFIVLNTVAMLVNIELTGYHIKDELFTECTGLVCTTDISREHASSDFFLALEHMFTAVFLVELLLRLAAFGLHFFGSIAHILDSGVVIISIADLWIIGPLLGSKGSSGMAVLRMARLAKLAKVFRVVRVLRAFEPLRLLVTTIYQSTSSLLWSLALLFVFELIGSIFLAQLLQPYVYDGSNDIDMRRRVWQRFGTWSRAMYTAYEITMAPGGFIQYRTIIEEVSPLVGVFFVLYGCTVTFAVIRVITALFLKETLSVCGKEEAHDALRTMQRRTAFAEKLQEGIDEDGSGGIDYDEFESLIQIPQMKDWLDDAELSSGSVKRLFAALMSMETNEVDFHEFLDALGHMKGPPRPSSLMLIFFETKKLMDHTTFMIKEMEKRLPPTVGNIQPERLSP